MEAENIAGKLAHKIIPVLLAVVLVLSACGEAASARQALDGFVNGFKSHDYKKAMVYVYGRDSMTFAGDTQHIMDRVADSMKVSTVSEGVSRITVKVTTIDLRLIYRDATKTVIDEYYNVAVSGNVITDGELRTAIEEKAVAMAGSESAPVVTTEIELEMISEGGKWYINLDANTYNVFTGYLTSANDMLTDGSILEYKG